jgi:hypothetical protein
MTNGRRACSAPRHCSRRGGGIPTTRADPARRRRRLDRAARPGTGDSATVCNARVTDRRQLAALRGWHAASMKERMPSCRRVS